VGDDEKTADLNTVVADHAGGDDEASETYWPTGEPKLTPTETWMEHKGWAS
jgi:hypothetical protein